MVSLAVAESVTPTIKSESLRDSAFWYPKIPGISLYLNDDYFAARDSSTTMYQPLCWTMFGGPRGVYLHHLTGISVTCRSNLRGIEFHYNSEHIPIECRKLGRYKSSEYDEVIHFDIAGPSGEDIDNIKVYYRHYDSDRLPWFYRRGVLMSFKVNYPYLETIFGSARIALTNTYCFINDLDYYESRKILLLWTEKVYGGSRRACGKAYSPYAWDYRYRVLLESGM